MHSSAVNYAKDMKSFSFFAKQSSKVEQNDISICVVILEGLLYCNNCNVMATI